MMMDDDDDDDDVEEFLMGWGDVFPTTDRRNDERPGGEGTGLQSSFSKINHTRENAGWATDRRRTRLTPSYLRFASLQK